VEVLRAQQAHDQGSAASATGARSTRSR
jgi:hypothetical protein